jgi:DNA-directed RNA polymerase subunit RPC12/RpoP
MGSDVIYSSFPTLVPTESNKVVGGIHTDNYVYCRHCIRILGLKWEDMKHLTRNRAKMYVYNCKRCGREITQKMTNRI